MDFLWCVYVLIPLKLHNACAHVHQFHNSHAGVWPRNKNIQEPVEEEG